MFSASAKRRRSGQNELPSWKRALLASNDEEATPARPVPAPSHPTDAETADGNHLDDDEEDRGNGDHDDEEEERGNRIYEDDDDDDDDNFDPSIYDVGDEEADAESGGAGQAAPAADNPDLGGWPPVAGQLIEARYLPTSTWKKARVMRVKDEFVTVVFGGYGDEVTLPADRVQPLAHERASALATQEVRFGRTGAWGAPRRGSAAAGALPVEMESEEERLTREMCTAVYQQQQATTSDEQSAEPSATSHRLDSTNKGHQMLRKLGWEPGSGLGMQADGATALVSDTLPTQSGRTGLGHCDTTPGGWRKL